MLNIIKPQIEDIDQLRIILAQWTEAEEVKKYLKRIFDEINGTNKFNMQFWVAKREKKVFGIIGLCNPLLKIISFSKTDNPGEIKILYVDSNEHGKGIGKELVAYLEKQAKQQKYSELLVRSAEKYRYTAYEFYEKIGYKKAGVINGGVDIMQVFRKTL